MDGSDGNGCRYLILVQRVSPRDKLNPIRVSLGCIMAVRARVADDYGSRFSSFVSRESAPISTFYHRKTPSIPHPRHGRKGPNGSACWRIGSGNRGEKSEEK